MNKAEKKIIWISTAVHLLMVIVVIIVTYFYVSPLRADYEEVLKFRDRNYIPDIFPVSGRITGTFGQSRKHPITGRKYRHQGLDIACRVNTKLQAAASGIVENVELTSYYGIKITLLHVSKKNRYKTIYGHLYVTDVSKGEYVNKGQVIGHTGNTGRTSGPHLHYEILKARFRRNRFFWRHVDPFPYCKGLK